jgi:hypothetical protein
VPRRLRRLHTSQRRGKSCRLAFFWQSRSEARFAVDSWKRGGCTSYAAPVTARRERLPAVVGIPRAAQHVIRYVLRNVSRSVVIPAKARGCPRIGRTILAPHSRQLPIHPSPPPAGREGRVRGPTVRFATLPTSPSFGASEMRHPTGASTLAPKGALARRVPFLSPQRAERASRHGLRCD